MISFSTVEITSVTSKPGKEKGIECKKKLLMKTCGLSAFLYEPERQRLSTGSAGEPILGGKNVGTHTHQLKGSKPSLSNRAAGVGQH